MESTKIQTILRSRAQNIGSDTMLPIHFFTIVLNGMPFIRQHFARFSELKVPWHWHIVEGVAELKHDTAWSVCAGGRIPENYHRDGRSIDGTSEYLAELSASHPEEVTVYRKARGQFWEGKREMVGAPLKNLPSECLLWEVDVDEFWPVDSIARMHAAFEANHTKTAAWYWCNFHVSSDLVVCTRNCYSQNPQQEWLRTWRYRSGDTWARHEPPVLVRGAGDHKGADVAKIDAFDQNATESLGAVFDHLAYVKKEQLVFKESYYGYSGALQAWQRLQADATTTRQPLRLSDYFTWVSDTTYVRSTELRNPDSASVQANPTRKPPMVLVDGVVFQDSYNPGIARVWSSVLREWVKSGFSKYVSVLDRGSTCPDIPGINRIPFPQRNLESRGCDALHLQEACDAALAKVFVSTNYTAPIKTPSVCVVYDFIPEKLGCAVDGPDWQEKGFAICHASALLCISQNTLEDLKVLYPHVRSRSINWAHLGVDKDITRKNASEVNAWRERHSINKPYFLIVGERVGLLGDRGKGRGYKNACLFFRAFKRLGLSETHQIVLFGGRPELEEELAEMAGASTLLLRKGDEELALAYSGAECLVYPSKYEGFGLPVAEAITCGCPVITSSVASLPEVGGSSAVYLDPESEASMENAIKKVLSAPTTSSAAPKDGKKRDSTFDWPVFASALQQSLADAAELPVEHAAVWQELRERQSQCELQSRRHLIRKVKQMLLNPADLKLAVKRRVRHLFHD